MQKLVSYALAAILLVACERPLEPGHSGLRPQQHVASDALAERIAYRRCFTDWSTDAGITCLLNVANGDGTLTSYTDYVNEPSWSPDGTRIATDNYYDVAVVNLADGSTTVLTDGVTFNHSAAWSPDGARIAFVSDRTGAPELYTMNAADGSDMTRVTDNMGFSGNPAWFPDGSRIVFDCEVDAGNRDVCSIAPDGSGFMRLTSDPAPDHDAAVSPDGTRIAFGTGRYGSSGLALMNADGSDVTRLPAVGYANEPAWSPGGGRLSFTRYYVGACNDFCENYVYTMNADGSNALFFASGSSAVWRPGPGDPPPAPDQPPVAVISYACTDLQCSFDSFASTDDHQVTQADWNLGDGTLATQSSVTYTYKQPGTYTVTLTVHDGSGQTSKTSVNVTLTQADQLPVAQFTASCTGLICAFNSSASSDDHGIVNRIWNFGDGSSVTGGGTIAPSHGYAAGGNYLVTLTVIDGLGQSSSTSQTVTAVDQPPVAKFSYSCASGLCTFDGRASTDDIGVATYSWDFGKQGTASGSVVKLTPKGKVSFVATLTVRDGAGQTSTATQTVILK